MIPLLGACSFIYNPDHINREIDAQVVDVEMVVDVNPAGLALTYAYPSTINEGAGTGGARKALVVIRGEEIAPTATVTIKPMTGAETQIIVDPPVIADDHRWIAATITVPVDPLQDETGAHMTTPLALMITVDNGEGHSVTMPAEALAVKWLDQLETPLGAPLDPAAHKVYAAIDVMAAQSFAADSSLHRVELHSASSITFHAGITANANGINPGAGGCAGGPSDSVGATTASDGGPCSSGHVGAAGSTKGGGGGGYALPGDTSAGGLAGGDAIGEPQFSTVGVNVGGGGGGGNSTLSLVPGGAGGGGGGVIYLDAAGDVMLTKNTTTSVSIAANGALGVAGGLLAGAGGGGAGGTLLLRAGGILKIDGTVGITGAGGGGSGNTMGGAAHEGRIRYDAAQLMWGAPTGYQGPQVIAAPSISTAQILAPGMITVSGQVGNSTDFMGLTYQKDGTPVPDSNFTLLFGNGTAMPTVKLAPGYNRVCVHVPGGNILTAPESGNCVEVAFLPGA
ncbi:MAG: hypothetical protein ABI678_03740 [Kofleriaceae bacterium]